MRRRDFIRLAAAAPVLRCSAVLGAPARVVVVGAGYGGATAAKYLRLWSDQVEVILIDREPSFVSCPLSNLVIGGHRSIADVSRGLEGLRKRGVQIVNDEAIGIDTSKRTLRLRRGAEVAYDRLILSPGVDLIYGDIEGYEAALASGKALHAWKAGPQTVALRKQLEAMPDGGVFVITVPELPYRCPPAPYERACQAASYFKRAKPRSKIVILDANPDVTSKGTLFRRAWAELYPGMIDYRPNTNIIAVDAKAMEARSDFDTVKGDVLNVVPPQRAGQVAASAGVVTHNKRWCDVDWRSCESTAVKNVHVLGDATLSADAMPKAGHMANQQAKLCAAAVISMLGGKDPDQQPVLSSTCYSFMSATEAVHVASVHQWDAARRTVVPVKGAGGLSAARSEQEGVYAWSWAQNIWADMLS